MNTTEKENKVLKAFLISDYGEKNDPLWMWEVKDNSGLSGKQFSGVCSSLTEKKLIVTDVEGDRSMLGVEIADTYTITLTDLGLETLKQIA